MSDVQFDTDIQNNAMYARPKPMAGFGQNSTESSGIEGWILRHGFAKTRTGAQGLMIGMVVANIIITIIVIKYFLL